MVRRRGVYEVSVLGKPLACLFCGGKTFMHREMYMKLVSYEEGVPKKKLTLQSLTCTACGQSVQFEERDGNLVYVEVEA